MQPYLVLDTDDYEVKKEMKSGISHFYEFSKKKSLKEEMKAVPDGEIELGVGQELFHMDEGDFAVVFPNVIHHYQLP